jgi:hypothetical protein
VVPTKQLAGDGTVKTTRTHQSRAGCAVPISDTSTSILASIPKHVVQQLHEILAQAFTLEGKLVVHAPELRHPRRHPEVPLANLGKRRFLIYGCNQ